MPTTIRLAVVVVALLALAGCYNAHVLAPKDAPSYAPATRAAHVAKEPAGSEYLGRVRVFGGMFTTDDGCRSALLDDARERGADIVSGARPFPCSALDAVDWTGQTCCEGDAYRSPSGQAKSAPPVVAQ